MKKGLIMEDGYNLLLIKSVDNILSIILDQLQVIFNDSETIFDHGTKAFFLKAFSILYDEIIEDGYSSIADLVLQEIDKSSATIIDAFGKELVEVNDASGFLYSSYKDGYLNDVLRPALQSVLSSYDTFLSRVNKDTRPNDDHYNFATTLI